MFLYHEHGLGMLALFIVIAMLSVFAGLPAKETPHIFLAGEIASKNVTADKEIIIEDTEATRLRHEQIRAMQPLIFDVDKKSASRVREDILSLLHTLNTSVINHDQTSLDTIVTLFNNTYNTSLDTETFKLLAKPKTQEYAFNILLHWIDTYLLAGVLPNMRLLDNSQNSIIVRNRDNKAESVRTSNTGLIDVHTLTVALGNKIRSDNAVDAKTQGVLIEVFPRLLLPTLAMNQDASDERIEEILLSIEPVFYHINKGEILVRRGDRVTEVDQIKMQALFESQNTVFNFMQSIGAFFLGFTFLAGLYMTPSGVKGRILKKKDQLFIALILLLVGTSITFFSRYIDSSSSNLEQVLIPFAFPIAGIAGLTVLIFSARRYCVVGLLLSFYATILFNADIELFIFYFLSTMVSTWLILRTQSRQDVVWSTIPLLISLLLLGFAAASVYGLTVEKFTDLAFFLFINTILSILILFALSPVLEMFFGYTTRFRLMELLSLDHPLLQELMMSVPGTYHHALVLSNLVESGAKAIGANSLLVKVGALYHDIGKIAKPEYFSENQFDKINPHDKLSPAMSCLILFSHVKKGIELAQEYKLGSEIIDMIQQHHGTRMPTAFYNKAVNLGETPKEADYRYPGPRPQSKEVAILMMADTVEAAIRSMGDPSPARIQSSVEILIKNIYAEGQLDETDLTFKDLTKLIDSFTRSLTGLYHQRIAYASIKKTNDTKTENNTDQKTENNADSATQEKPIDKNSEKSNEKANIDKTNIDKTSKDNTQHTKTTAEKNYAKSSHTDETKQKTHANTIADFNTTDTETTNLMFMKKIGEETLFDNNHNDSKEPQ